MKILNITRGTVIASEARKVHTLKEYALGLLLHKNPTTLFFRTRWGIHTFGMKYPIDVLILSSNKTVVNLKKHLVPHRIFLWNPRYSMVLELPEGSIHKSETTEGDKLRFVLE